MIHAVGIIVPVHDERELLPACLVSLRAAARHSALRALAVHIVPVLDACDDDSGEVAGSGIEVGARNVGIARAAGFAEVLRREAGRPTTEIWLATTDADSTVPVDWLAVQLRLARAGAPGDGHLHVHGANLGISAEAYVDAGGVPPLALAEDHALVDTLRSRGKRLVATGRIPVATSGRRESRTVGGFADHLRGH